MSKSEKRQKRRHSLKCYNGSANDHKTREGMPYGIEQIRKFFFEKHFDFLTGVYQRHIQEVILSSCKKGNSGKWWTMVKAVQFIEQRMAIFWQRGSGMTNGWRKRKNTKVSRRFRNLFIKRERLFLSALMIRF